MTDYFRRNKPVMKGETVRAQENKENDFSKIGCRVLICHEVPRVRSGSRVKAVRTRSEQRRNRLAQESGREQGGRLDRTRRWKARNGLVTEMVEKRKRGGENFIWLGYEIYRTRARI